MQVQARTLGGFRGCMRLHGAWSPCMFVASDRAVCGRVQVGPITFSQTEQAHEIVRKRTSRAVSENVCPTSCKFHLQKGK